MASVPLDLKCLPMAATFVGQRQSHTYPLAIGQVRDLRLLARTDGHGCGDSNSATGTNVSSVVRGAGDHDGGQAANRARDQSRHEFFPYGAPKSAWPEIFSGASAPTRK
jgi:hypothetical protein